MKNIDTYSWTNEKIEVRESLNGIGIFAKNRIKKEEIIVVFGGYVTDIKEAANLPECIWDNSLQISEELMIGIMKESEIEKACFFNHSCSPNAGFKGQIFLVAMRNIKKNEQVTFDYSMVLFRSRNGVNYKFDCNCGEKECRGSVTNNDWKKKEIQKKYKGYFQYFLEEKIRGNK